MAVKKLKWVLFGKKMVLSGRFYIDKKRLNLVWVCLVLLVVVKEKRSTRGRKKRVGKRSK